MVCNVRAEAQDKITRPVLIGNFAFPGQIKHGSRLPGPSCVTFRKPALIFRAICINLQSDGVTDQM